VKWNFNETEIKIDFWRKALLLVLMDYSCRAGWCKKRETRVNAEGRKVTRKCQRMFEVELSKG
jgi:hypothetical protein